MTNQQITNKFEPFGAFYDEPLDTQKHNLNQWEFSASSKKLDTLFLFPCEVYIECPAGLGLLLIATDPDMTELKTFPLRHNLKLAPNTAFNVIPLASSLTWNILIGKNCCKEQQLTDFTKPLSTPYTYQPVSVPFHLRRILDCWFTKQSKACHIVQPAHKSYELIYVYEGSLDITLSSGTNTLQPHDLIIYRSDKADLSVQNGCSYLTVVFEVNHRRSLHILNHTFHCTSEMQQILWKLLIESEEHSYYTHTLMVCYLQEVLLLIMQFYETMNHKTLLTDSKSAQNDLLSEILAYMNKRLTEPLTIEDICHEFFISRSSLQALFKTHLNTSPKNYLLNIKLQKSKELIRENQYTISEIAYRLGFSSIHYFSRLFKKYFNTTPSDYARKSSRKPKPPKQTLITSE